MDATGAVSVAQVHFNSTTSLVTDSNLSDLRTSSNGPIKVQSVSGDIVVNDGIVDGAGIVADSAGDVLLQALSGAVIVNSQVNSTSGNISLVASSGITINSTVMTVNGNVLAASGNSVFMNTVLRSPLAPMLRSLPDRIRM